MEDLNTFKGRFQYGDVAVDEAKRILDFLEIQYKTSKEFWKPNWTNILDKEFGDLILLQDVDDPIWIDVKRNSIPKESLNAFNGDYFWIFHHFVDYQNLLITKQEVLDLDLPLYELASKKSVGYKIKDIYGKVHRSIEDIFID